MFSCEIDEEARDIYELNWEEPVSEYDIRDFEANVVPPHDVLLACWPCPSFSRMGKKEGLADARGSLFFEIIKILNEKRPKAFLLENVKNLKFINDGRAFETVERALHAAGYRTTHEVLNALDFGLPQHRERLIMIGLREDIAPEEFSLPTEHPENALKTEAQQRAALAELLEDDPDEKYIANEPIQESRREVAGDFDAHPTPSIWHENRSGGVTVHPYASALRASSSWNYLLVDGQRRPTVRELFRFQGFPDWFDPGSDHQRRSRRLTGNSVPIPMIQSCARSLLGHM